MTDFLQSQFSIEQGRPAAGHATMKKLLLVDDEKAFLSSLSEGLRLADDTLDIFTAENGEQALEMMQSVNIDLLITDLKMPIMDGFDLLERVIKDRPDMPIIVMSAFSIPAAQKRFCGVNNIIYLEKPLEFEEIVHAICHLLA